MDRKPFVKQIGDSELATDESLPLLPSFFDAISPLKCEVDGILTSSRKPWKRSLKFHAENGGKTPRIHNLQLI